jgi:CubicO group peptidase (beta-lactamase class C family)
MDIDTRSYSSPGYVLLAHIIEQVTGERYASALSEMILRPLRLERTGVGNNPPTLGERAAPYANAAPTPSFELDTVGTGTGDIWATTGDMAQWDDALTAARLLNPASTVAMFAPQAPVPENGLGLTDVHYGYGWYIADLSGHPLVFHLGDNARFQSVNVILPDEETCAVVLANDEYVDNEKICLRIVRELLRLPR